MAISYGASRLETEIYKFKVPSTKYQEIQQRDIYACEPQPKMG